jgi:hypothetical protein
MKGCLLFPTALLGGLLVGVTTISVLHAATGNEDLSCALGTGVCLVCTLLMVAYGPLWVYAPEEIAANPLSTSTIRNEKAEHKYQTAELRMGFVFALVGGTIAKIANGPAWVIAVAVVGHAVFGGLIGFDIKRRVKRIRERFAANRSLNSDSGAGNQQKLRQSASSPEDGYRLF